MGTQFASVYNRFLGKITDDMYMELTPQDTIADLQKMLIESIPGFEFPRISLSYSLLTRPVTENTANKHGFVITDAEGNGFEDASTFDEVLTSEEIDILATLMLNIWLNRQIASIEHIRMKYSGPDFKLTSQAAHLSKLLALLEETRRQSHHMQRLYKRRKTENGQIKSNWSAFRTNAAATTPRDEVKTVILDGGVI